MTPELLAHDLRQALRRLVRPVAVVTTSFQGRRFAMAATAFAEVSLTPPSMLVCINRENAIFAALEAGADFALNILSDDHEDVSRACGGGCSGADRFLVGAWADEQGLPMLSDACARILLRPASFIDHGSHRVIIGNVRSVLLNEAPQALAFHDGSYLSVAHVSAAA